MNDEGPTPGIYRHCLDGCSYDNGTGIVVRLFGDDRDAPIERWLAEQGKDFTPKVYLPELA